MAKTESTSSEFARVARSRRKIAPRFMVQVTREIIDCAVPKDSQHCMIADAVKAVFPDAVALSVDLQTIRFSDPAKDLRYIYLTPRIAQLALLDFDRGVMPIPFQFPMARAVQIVSMQRRKKRNGPSVAVHKFKKGIQDEGGYGNVPTVIGGRVIPRLYEGPPSSTELPPGKAEGLGSGKAEALASGVDDISLMRMEVRNRGRVRKRRAFGLRGFKTGLEMVEEARRPETAPLP